MFAESRRKDMTTPSDAGRDFGTSDCSSSPALLFTFDEAKNVIRLQDGSEIPGSIIESIDIQYLDEPANEYQEWKPIAVEAVIRIKDGWLWRNTKTVYASEHRVR
jgi:hypothetical protein